MTSLIDTLKGIDNAILLFINGIHSPFWDKVMMLVSAKFTWVPLYALLLFLIIRHFGKNSWVIVLFVVATIALSDQLASHLIKNMVMRYRPTHNLILSPYIHIVNNYRGGLYGFVSSHAANTTALTAFIALLMPEKRTLKALLICWVALVCYSRMYLGVHYPSDIAGGIVVGLISAWITNRLWQYTNRRFLLK